MIDIAITLAVAALTIKLIRDIRRSERKLQLSRRLEAAIYRNMGTDHD